MLPMLKAEVLKVAVPVEFRAAVPSVVLPAALTSLKVTVPVGVPEPVVWETVAVKVTDAPEATVPSGETVTVVLVAAVPVTVSVAMSVWLLNAVVPPLSAVLTSLPAIPLISGSQAQYVIFAGPVLVPSGV